MISIVVPCYNEEDSLPLFYETISSIITTQMSEELFEVIFIDDGSRDRTLDIIKKLSEEDKLVKYISFSRNFGKESGILAGLERSKGDFVAIIDVDMQDPPSLLPEMYKILSTTNEYDCVATRRTTRKGEPPIRSFFAKCFYKLINKISDVEIVDGARDFRLMTRSMVDAILSTKEYNRFSKGIFSWVGFKTKWIEYSNIERAFGETKWSFFKLFLYSIDGIIAFSTVPLAISSIIGVVFCFISIVISMVYVFKTIVLGEVVAGFPTLICVILLLGGIQLFCTGILGQYLSKTYMEVKKRPSYIIRECTKESE